MAGLVPKTLKDGAGVPFTAWFYDDDTALFGAHVLVDAITGNLIDLTSGAAGAPDGGVTSVQGVDNMKPVMTDWKGDGYETVAASQSDQVLGTTGASGDRISHIVIIPATKSPGAVTIKDGAGSAITVFAGGTDSLASLASFPIMLGMVSSAGAWSVTTGADVSVIAVGKFS